MLSSASLHRFLSAPVCLLTLVSAPLVGCERAQGNKPANQHMNRDIADGIHDTRSSLHRLLTSNDLTKFRPERAKDDILKDIQWRGNFEMATEFDGNHICAISFGLTAKEYSEGMERRPTCEQKVLWAIFCNDVFIKFVEWPGMEMEEDELQGTKASRVKPSTAGDFTRLKAASNSEPIDIVQLVEQMKKSPPGPYHVDPGFTIAFLALKVLGLAPSPSDAEYKKNAAIREQFNASRLSIGMTESEVESVFQASSLESGELEAGTFRIYGSRESFDIPYPLHFINVLILYRHGKVFGVYSGDTITSGSEWRMHLEQTFRDLPKPAPP